MGVADGIGVVVHVDALDVSLALLEVEMFDVVLLPAVKVDGFFVDEHKRAGEIDFADDAGRAGDVDDHEIVAGDGTQADGIGGISFLRPVIVFSGEMQKTCFGEARAKIGEMDIAEFVAWSDGQFECGAFQMIDEDFEIVGLDEGVLRSVAEEIVGMTHDELIERRGRCDQHGT